MTGPGALAARIPAIDRQTLFWCLAAAAAGAVAAIGVAPFVILAGVLLIACGIGMLQSPLLFLWIITAISGLGFGWTDSAALHVAGRSININGLRWALVILTSLLILARLRRASLPRAFRLYALFLLLGALGVLWSPDRFEGIKELLLFAAPLLTAVVVLQTVNTEEDILALRASLYVAAAIGTVIGIAPSLAGDALGGPFDPGGRLLHRAFGTFLLPVIALSLARLKYGSTRQALVVVLLFALTLATLSRTTIATILLLAFFTIGRGSLRARLGIAALLAVCAWGALLYRPLRDRIFAEPGGGFSPTIAISGTGERAQLELGGVQLSGRGVLWLQTWAHARQRPVLGHGTGAATHYLGTRGIGGILHPHNEYLRIFHDLGVVGLAALLAAFAAAIAAFARLRRAAEDVPLARELALAALLCWVGFALVAIFDNVLLYFVFFTYNIFLISALALRASQLAGVRPPGGA